MSQSTPTTPPVIENWPIERLCVCGHPPKAHSYPHCPLHKPEDNGCACQRQACDCAYYRNPRTLR